MKNIITITILCALLMGCKQPRFGYVLEEGYKASDKRDIFLECLKRTKSSVTNANDDQDTDDTIRQCSISAHSIVYKYDCVENCN